MRANRPHRRRPYPVGAAALLALLCFLVGCTAGRPSSSASSPGAAGSTAKSGSGPTGSGTDVAETPRDRVKDGGTYTVAIDQWITQWNPYHVDGTEGDGVWLGHLALPALWSFDSHAMPRVNPDVLVSAAVTATTPRPVITYAINPKATWDDGTPITWKDFAQQWRALNGTDKAYLVASSDGYEDVASVTAGSDERHVVVTFSKPFADWQSLFDPLLPATKIATPAQFNKGWLGQPPLTGGPWKFQNFDKTAQTVAMVPDPHYWGTKPKLGRLVARVISSSVAVTDAFLNREVDRASARLPADYRRLSGAKGTDIRSGSPWDISILTLSSRGILADQTVRQAIQRAVDRPALAKVVSAGLPVTPRVLQSHFFMPDQQGYQDNAGEYGTFDVAAAGKLLDQAGWRSAGGGQPRTKDGKPLELSYVVGSSRPTTIPELLQNMLGRVGIKVDIQKVPDNDYFEKYINTGSFDLSVFRWTDAKFPSSILSIYRQPQGNNVFQNYGRIGSPEIDGLLNQAAMQTDVGASRVLYNKADAAIWKLAVSLPLFQTPQLVAVRSGLVNDGAWGLAGDQQNVNTGWTN